MQVNSVLTTSYFAPERSIELDPFGDEVFHLPSKLIHHPSGFFRGEISRMRIEYGGSGCGRLGSSPSKSPKVIDSLIAHSSTSESEAALPYVHVRNEYISIISTLYLGTSYPVVQSYTNKLPRPDERMAAGFSMWLPLPFRSVVTVQSATPCLRYLIPCRPSSSMLVSPHLLPPFASG